VAFDGMGGGRGGGGGPQLRAGVCPNCAALDALSTLFMSMLVAFRAFRCGKTHKLPCYIEQNPV